MNGKLAVALMIVEILIVVAIVSIGAMMVGGPVFGWTLSFRQIYGIMLGLAGALLLIAALKT